MLQKSRMKTADVTVISGVLSGLASVLVFMIVHAIWITPIWFIFPIGVVLAAGGGMAVSRAYVEFKHRLPPPPWTVMALTAIVFATLLPAFILAQLHQPFFALDGTLLVGIPVLVKHFVVDLLLTAACAGALIGWGLARTRRAALATALAGVAFALGPGHNTIFFTISPDTSGPALKMLALITTIVVVAAVVLVYSQMLLHQSKLLSTDDLSDRSMFNRVNRSPEE